MQNFRSSACLYAPVQGIANHLSRIGLPRDDSGSDQIELVEFVVLPLYEYELVDGECRACGGQFEIRRPIGRPPLTRCPLCRQAVRKCVSRTNSPRVVKPLSVVDAKKAGFTVLEKRDAGVYEKL